MLYPYPITNVIKRDSICHTFKKWRIPLFGIKNEEHHENVAKIPLDFGYTFKKRRTPFLGLKIKKNNKKMAKTLGFWVYLQKKKNPYSWVTGRRKTTKYSKSGNPLDKPTKIRHYGIFRPMSFMDLLDSQKIGKV
jgi:hypothetical protein